MNKKINESFNFLILEYKRLKLKEKKNTLKDCEKETLNKLTSFVGKEDEK
jgi:hypothetical protein